MGESISLLQGAASSPDVHTYLIQLNIEARGNLLTSNKLFKTIECVVEGEGKQICKLYIKTAEQIDLDLAVYESLFKAVNDKLSNRAHPNLVTGQFSRTDVSSSQKVGAICRQFFSSSLRQRFIHHPELRPIENLWLAYQLLQAVKQLHNAQLCHGNINAENVMLTSWQWLLLT